MKTPPAKKRRLNVKKLEKGATFKICVTEDDIARGDPQESDRCPIARQLKKLTGSRDVAVGGGSGWDNTFRLGKLEYCFRLDKKGNAFIKKFDDLVEKGKERLKKVKPDCFIGKITEVAEDPKPYL